MAQTPAKTKDHPDVQRMQKQREAQQKSNEEAMKRMEQTQPTPTQEEGNLAKLGVAVEEKEPDGSGPTVIRTTTLANVPLGYEPDIPDAAPQGKSEAEQRAARERAAQAERDRAKAATNR